MDSGLDRNLVAIGAAPAWASARRLGTRLAQTVGGTGQDGSMPTAVTSPALDGFSEPTRAWFSAAFAEPTQAQAQAWASIGNGENALVIAPTGSGKTLAAFL